MLFLTAALLSGDGSQAVAESAATEMIVERTAAAGAALDALSAALTPALDEARTGASRAIQGEEAPSQALLGAAQTVEGASTAAAGAARSVRALDDARRTRDPNAVTLPHSIDTSELDAIADELRAAGPIADDFAEMRRGSEDLLGHVDGALGSLVAGRLPDAAAEARAARADHDALVGWSVGSETLPHWLATTDAMISAVTALIDARIANDPQAAVLATAQLAAIRLEAVDADRGLRIALSEGADAVTRPAVQRLAAALSSIAELRASIAGGSLAQ